MFQSKRIMVILVTLLFIWCLTPEIASAQFPDIFSGYIDGAERARRDNLRDMQAAEQIRQMQINNIQQLIALANKGHPGAQCELGMMFYTGRGLPKDDSKAAYWFQNAAEQGSDFAQNNLGVMYYEGQGVRKDYAKALYWYQKSAAQGNAFAQYNIGELYEKGQGVAKDKTQATYWYQKAADQGLREAKNRLKKLR
jgi:TPR repeat protein